MHLVVIGGVAAGMSAASRARRLSRDLKITVLERSSVVSYGACGLPYWIGGTVQDPDSLVACSQVIAALTRLSSFLRPA